jgi:hypothetical protein
MNACLHFDPEGWFGYIEGYKMAGDFLVQHVAKQRGDQDFLVYPIVFNCRHYAELALKYLIRQTKELLGMPSDFSNEHDLRALCPQPRSSLALTIPFYAVEAATYETRDTVLVIEPESSRQGPRLRLPIRVRPPVKRATVAVSGSVLGLVLLGIPALFPDLGGAIKLLFIVGGGLMTGVLATLGLRRS